MARITKPVEERRKEIIEIAKQMFLENGYEKTQVADISKKMNVASGLIFHYFKSKAEILYAVIDEFADDRLLELKDTLDKSKGSALSRLNLFLAPPQESGEHKKLFISLASDRAITEYCKQKMTATSMQLVCSLIEEGNEDGSWSCEFPRETAVFILRGLAELIEMPKTAQEKDIKVIAITSIIYRVLGVTK